MDQNSGYHGNRYVTDRVITAKTKFAYFLANNLSEPVQSDIYFKYHYIKF